MSGAKNNPVTAAEVMTVVLAAIAQSFGKRPLDTDTARAGLKLAQMELIHLHLKAIAEQEKDK